MDLLLTEGCRLYFEVPIEIITFWKYKSFKEIAELSYESQVRWPSPSTTHTSPHNIPLAGKHESLATNNCGSKTSENILKD